MPRLRIRDVISEDDYRKLVAAFGGEVVYIPKGNAKTIILEMWHNGYSIERIVRATQKTKGYIYKIIRENAKKQTK